MGHNRRFFESKKCYALTFRVREGLPFVATFYMRLLLGGIVARAQRDFKVILSHMLWMGNHPHFILVTRDAYQLTCFYAEVQKKITDTLKQLLRLPTLNLWQGYPIVAQVLDVNAAINQIAYLYANPARANLVDHIANYPGFSTYADFRTAGNSVDTTVSSREYWVPSSLVPALPSYVMRKHQDLDFTAELKELGIPHELIIEPNAWMKCFNDINSEEDVRQINERILEALAEKEAEHAQARAAERRVVIGEKALRVRSIKIAHVPPPIERRIFVISSEKDLRIAFITRFRALCDEAAECFRKALCGIHCEWPPGIFRPSLRHLASACQG